MVILQQFTEEELIAKKKAFKEELESLLNKHGAKISPMFTGDIYAIEDEWIGVSFMEDSGKGPQRVVRRSDFERI